MERHILLIDDDIDEMDFFLFAQKEMPGRFTCSYLADVTEGLKMILDMQPDLVFLDINMPRMKGPDFLMHLKKTGLCENIKVVLYSTNITTSDSRMALSFGAFDCIQKPVLFTSFCSMLAELFEKLGHSGKKQ